MSEDERKNENQNDSVPPPENATVTDIQYQYDTQNLSSGLEQPGQSMQFGDMPHSESSLKSRDGLKVQYDPMTGRPYYAQEETVTGGYIQPKKKGKKALAAIIAILLVIGLGVGAAFVFAGDQIKNTMALYTKSDTEYFQWVEEKSVQKLKDSYSQNYKDMITEDSTVIESAGYQGKLEMGMKLGKKLSKLLTGEEDLGRFTLSADAARKDGKLNFLYHLLYGNKDLLTFQMLADTAEGKTLIAWPELLEGYLDISEYVKFQYGTGAKVHYSELAADAASLQFNKMLDTYYLDTLKQIKDVEIEKNQTLKAGDLEVNATKITASVTLQEGIEILKEICSKLKNDQYINVLMQNNVQNPDFKQILSQAEELLSQATDVTDGKVKINVYTNSKGDIVGRNIIFETDVVIKAGYASLWEGERNCITGDISVAGMQIITFNQDTKKTGDKTNGSMTIDAPILSMALGTTGKFSLIITYEDLISTLDQISGKITMKADIPESAKLGDFKLGEYLLTINYDLTETKLNVDIIVLEKDQPFAEFNLKYDLKEQDSDISLSTGDARIYNMETESLEYVDPAALEQFLEQLKSKVDDAAFTNIIDKLLNDFNSPGRSEVKDAEGLYGFSDLYLADYVELGDYYNLDFGEFDLLELEQEEYQEIVASKIKEISVMKKVPEDIKKEFYRKYIINNYSEDFDYSNEYFYEEMAADYNVSEDELLFMLDEEFGKALEERIIFAALIKNADLKLTEEQFQYFKNSYGSDYDVFVDEYANGEEGLIDDLLILLFISSLP